MGHVVDSYPKVVAMLNLASRWFGFVVCVGVYS